MIPTMPKDSDERAVVRSPTTKLCWKAAPAAMMISVVMPGTCARAFEPSGSAASKAETDDAGRPAAVAAAGTILAASLDCTLLKIVE